MPHWIIAVLLSLLAAGCGMPVSLDYVATRPIVAASPGESVRVLQVIDQRGVDDPTTIGTVRGGYGNPVRRYKVERPLSDMVKRSFEEALAARGLQAASGASQHDLRVTIHQLYGEQLMRSEGRAALQLDVLDRETQGITYSDRSDVRRTEGISAGSVLFGAAAVVDLRMLMEQAQNEAIDQLLDKPGFRASVQPRGALRS